MAEPCLYMAMMGVRFSNEVPISPINRFMKIGFYGHSNCAYTGPTSYLDLIAERFNGSIVNTGARQGSEERILFELKKTKELDIAIIVHSVPGYIFLPGCDRDIALNELTKKRATHILEFDFHESYGGYPKTIKKFKTGDNFYNVIGMYRDYFYNPDLSKNRFYGSLIQIDQYLVSTNIPCIHIVSNDNSIPNWFKFQSGIVDYSISELFTNFKTHEQDSKNSMDANGNIAVADKLEKLMRLVVR